MVTMKDGNNTCRRVKIDKIVLNRANVQFEWTGRLEVAGVKCTLGLHERGA